MSTFTIRAASWPADGPAARALLRAYEAEIDADLGLQDFEAELAGLPGQYAAPEGAFVLAHHVAGEAVGCVALRPLAGERSSCEMKRFYVSPAARGSGLGRTLALAAIEAGRARGYRIVKLDVRPGFAAAFRLYRQLGFREVEPFGASGMPDLVYLGLDLQP